MAARFLADDDLDRVVAVSRASQPPPELAGNERLDWRPSDYSDASVAAVVEEVAAGGEDIVRVTD